MIRALNVCVCVCVCVSSRNLGHASIIRLLLIVAFIPRPSRSHSTRRAPRFATVTFGGPFLLFLFANERFRLRAAA